MDCKKNKTCTPKTAFSNKYKLYFVSAGKTMIAVENPPKKSFEHRLGFAPVCAGARKRREFV